MWPMAECDLEVACATWRKLPCERDRKSTRLNSSHSQISYAVFCLKKNNIHTQVQWAALDPGTQADALQREAVVDHLQEMSSRRVELRERGVSEPLAG